MQLGFTTDPEFSSKSQQILSMPMPPFSCCCYRKGTNFQANHNTCSGGPFLSFVVVATAKVRIFKQITTKNCISVDESELLLLPHRYEFSSKSQLIFLDFL